MKSISFLLCLFLLVLGNVISLGVICDICKGGNVTRPSMVLNFLYIGIASCKSYYEAGMRGLIPPHMCDVVQHYAYNPCECVFNGTVKPVSYTVSVTSILPDDNFG